MEISEKPELRVFISGPIASKPDTYKADFAAAKAEIWNAGFIPLNPADLPEGLEPGEYLKITLAMIDIANIVVALDGWPESDGANIEIGYAEYSKKPVMEWAKFIDAFTPGRIPDDDGTSLSENHIPGD